MELTFITLAEEYMTSIHFHKILLVFLAVLC